MSEHQQLWSYRDPVAITNVAVNTYPYGGGIPKHGVQLNLKRDGDERVAAVRLPAEHALALAVAIFAAYPGADTDDEEETAAPDDLMTPSEVARLYRVDPKTVTRWAKAGRIQALRTLGGHRRFRRADVVAGLEMRNEAEPP